MASEMLMADLADFVEYHKKLDGGANGALRYQHSQDGRDAIVAANLSANALAELAASYEHIDADALAVAQ